MMGSVSEALRAMTAFRPHSSPTGDVLLSPDPAIESGWPIRWMVFGAVVFGVICRLSQYAANTSLWHDEAFVALNALHKSFAELLGPLDWNQERTAYLAANLAVLASLGLLLGPIRAQATGHLLTFWVRIEAFPDIRSLGAFASWMWRSHLGLVSFFWHHVGALLLALALLGTIRLSRTGRRPELLILVLPVWMALAASFLYRWPFGANQHMVFAAPAAFLLIAEGTETLRFWLGRWHASAGWLLVALVLLPGILEAGKQIASPSRKHELRPVILLVQQHLEPGDQVLVFDPAPVEFYAGRDFPRSAVDAHPAARVWFISIRAGYKDFAITGKDTRAASNFHPSW